MVFGVYGNACDENPEFYAYHGTFDDCPIATVGADRTTLLGKEAFLENLSRLKSTHDLFPSSAKDRQGGDWKQYVGDFFDMSSLLQQHKYQLANGAEGSAKYFDVERSDGNYSAELFYKHLAPELLSELMGGYGADNEHGIEDTIHEKARGVVLARRETDEKARELAGAVRVLETLEYLDKIGATIATLTDEVAAAKSQLGAEYFALKNAFALRQMPGVPLPLTNDLPAFYNDLVLQDGQWWLTDRSLGNFSGDDARRVNERAGRSPIVRSTEVKVSQVIDFKCDNSIGSVGAVRSGPRSQLYSQGACVAMLEKTTKFADGWNREVALAEVKSAFAWVTSTGDTNPARTESMALELQLRTDKDAKTRAGFAREDARLREAEVRRDINLLAESAKSWEAIVNSRLFTQDELTDIVSTKESVKKQAATTKSALEMHLTMVGKRIGVQGEWSRFVKNHGEVAPSEMADRLVTEDATQCSRLERVLADLQKTNLEVLASDRAVIEINSAWQSLLSRIELASELALQAKGYAPIFGETDPTALEIKVLSDVNEARVKLKEANSSLAELADGLNAITAFESAKPKTSPYNWLTSRRTSKAALEEQIFLGTQRLESASTILSRAKQHLVAATNFHKYYNDEGPDGLEALVCIELQTAETAIQDHRHQLAQWKNALDALLKFKETTKSTDPHTWVTKRSHQHALATRVLQCDGAELKELRQLRSALDVAAVAPGAIARDVAAVAGPDGIALHDFVSQLNLDKARNASVLTLFSALLFAPVFYDLDAAKKAVENLAREAIEAPVFLASALEQFCRTGTITLSGDSASGLLVGIKTRKVACLLDPQLIDIEKQQLEQKITALEETCRTAQKELDDLSLSVELVPVATLAALALEQQLPSQASHIEAKIAHLSVDLPRLQSRASHDAVSTIRASLLLRSELELGANAPSANTNAAFEQLERHCQLLLNEVTKAQQEISQLRKEDSLEHTADIAATAISNNVPGKAIIARSEIAHYEALLPQLETLADPDAIQAIRAKIRLEKFLNGETISEMEEKRAPLYATKTEANDTAERLRQLRRTLENEKETVETEYRNAQRAALDVPSLLALQDYANDSEFGPAFMSTHEVETERRNTAMQLAQQRATFDFTNAQAFVVGGGASRLEALHQHHSTTLSKIQSLDELIKEKELEIDEAQVALQPLQRAAIQIDTAVHMLYQRWQKVSSVLDSPEPVPNEQLEQHVLWIAIQRWRNMSSSEEIALDMGRICDQLATADEMPTVDLLRNAIAALKRAKDSLGDEVDRTLKDPSLKLPETARVKLVQAKGSPELLTEMLLSGHSSHAKNDEANRIANDHLTLERAKLSEWLATFTLRLPDNLKTLRTVFSPSHGAEPGQTRAGFEIDATVIDSDGINLLIEKIILSVEELENGQLASMGTPEKLRKQINKTLRETIRDTFYRSVILNPRIRLVLPSISVRPLQMERNMASSGQGVAITFLWILKLAEFINEREIRRQSVDGAKRKRLRDKASAFTLLDGAFSHLSDKDLINETLAGIENSLGRFQLIITGHDPAYENDFKRFPALVVGREMNGHYMRAKSHHHQLDVDTDEGSMEAFNAIHVQRPFPTEEVAAQ